jgi:hypothetical protein
VYHDEFSRKPAKARSFADDAIPLLALEVGGGLSLGLAASLNQPISTLLYFLGGVLPLVTCCVSIAAHRLSETLTGLTPPANAGRISAVPVPHILTSTARVGGLHRHRSRAGSAR